MPKYQAIQKSTGLETGKPLTQKEKEAHESDPQLRGKYRYEELPEPKVPKTAKKVAGNQETDKD